MFECAAYVGVFFAVNVGKVVVVVVLCPVNMFLPFQFRSDSFQLTGFLSQLVLLVNLLFKRYSFSRPVVFLETDAA